MRGKFDRFLLYEPDAMPRVSALAPGPKGNLYVFYQDATANGNSVLRRMAFSNLLSTDTDDGANSDAATAAVKLLASWLVTAGPPALPLEAPWPWAVAGAGALLSGHSIKHLFAALTPATVLYALHQRGAAAR